MQKLKFWVLNYPGWGGGRGRRTKAYNVEFISYTNYSNQITLGGLSNFF